MRDLEDEEDAKQADGLALSGDEAPEETASPDVERDAVTKE